MTHLRVKLSIAGALLLAAVAFLSFAGARDGWVYYIQVDQLLNESKYQQQRVRLCGQVAAEGLDASPAQLRASFDLIGNGAQVPVVYRGVVPEMFKAGGEVVVEGQLDDKGVFQADIMLTKCASKYSADDHAKRLEGGQ